MRIWRRGLAASLLLWGPPSAAGEADISDDRERPTAAWLGTGAGPVAISVTDGRCDVSAAASAPLPADLRVEAHVPYPEVCGADWIFVRTAADLFDGPRSDGFFVARRHVSTAPPRGTPWEAKTPRGTAWIRAHPAHATVGIPLDEPRWTELYRLAPGESVDVLDPVIAVIRTANGRELALSPYELLDADPIGEPDARALWRRLAAGRDRHEPRGALAYLPTAELLEEGRAYEVLLDPEWLGERAFVAAWLDPVGQRLDHTCDPRRSRRDPEPCGAYWLDYSAFGAWSVSKRTRVIVLADGHHDVGGQRLPALKVVVQEPWTDAVRVSPAWDGP
jgi:hypothetical protein